MSAWMKSDTDRMLDLYFGGESSDKIAVKLDDSRENINRRLHAFIDDLNYRATDYEPLRRASRKGQKFTKHELDLIAVHKHVKVAVKDTARLLQREVSELQPDIKGKSQAKECRSFATSLDYFLACCYARDVYKIEVVGDDVFKDMEKEELEFGGGSTALQSASVPKRIISLAMYLVLRKEDDAK